MKTVAVAALLVFAITVSPLLADEPVRLSKYGAIVVEKFTVAEGINRDEFPPGYEGVLQKTTVAKLHVSRLFAHVVDATETDQKAPAEVPKIVLSGTVVEYAKGDRAARVLIGFGAGRSKVKVRFALRDAQSGQQLMEVVRLGTFAGTTTIGGGSDDRALAESARKTVDGFIQEITLRK